MEASCLFYVWDEDKEPCEASSSFKSHTFSVLYFIKVN